MFTYCFNNVFLCIKKNSHVSFTNAANKFPFQDNTILSYCILTCSSGHVLDEGAGPVLLRLLLLHQCRQFPVHSHHTVSKRYVL